MKMTKISAFLICTLLAVSCSEEWAGGTGADGGPPTGECEEQNAQRWLAHATPIQTNTGAGETVMLAAFVTDREKGLMSGVIVNFKIMQNPGDAYLNPNNGDGNMAQASTDAQGVAQVQIFVGNTPANYQVQISGDGLCSKYFTIIVEQIIKQIEIIGPSSRTAFIKESVPLQVRVTSSKGEPLDREVVEFLVKGSNPGAAVLEPANTLTGPGGDTMVDFKTGEIAHDYMVQARHAEAGTRDFSIAVSEQIEGGSCASSFDCAPGYYCEDGTCKQNPIENPPGQPEGPLLTCPDDTSGCVLDSECQAGQYCDSGECRTPAQGACSSKADCPKGYTCRNGECFPEFIGGSGDQCRTSADCANNLVCIDGDCLPDGSCASNDDCQAPNICRNGMCAPANTCIFDRDCQNGQFCDGSQCAPIPAGEEPPIDVSGRWITHHTFDLTNALGGLPRIAPYIDDVSQILQGHICNVVADWADINIPGFICTIIDGGWSMIVQTYVPQWIPDVVAGLDNLAYIFQEMRVKGEMNLTYTNNCDLLDGEEQWEAVTLYWIERCPQGRHDPQFPDCAAMDIMVEDVGMQVECKPFTAKTSGHTITIYEREVKAEVFKLISYVINMVINIASGGQYDNIEDFVVGILDCAAIDDALNNLIGGMFQLPFEDFCNDYKDDLGRLIQAQLDQIGVDWTAFKFSGYATIVDDGGRPQPRARLLKDGQWSGTVQVVFDGPLTGTWKANR